MFRERQSHLQTTFDVTTFIWTVSDSLLVIRRSHYKRRYSPPPWKSQPNKARVERPPPFASFSYRPRVSRPARKLRDWEIVRASDVPSRVPLVASTYLIGTSQSSELARVCQVFFFFFEMEKAGWMSRGPGNVQSKLDLILVTSVWGVGGHGQGRSSRIDEWVDECCVDTSR